MSNCITNACELELQIGYHVAGKQITADWNKCNPTNLRVKHLANFKLFFNNVVHWIVQEI